MSLPPAPPPSLRRAAVRGMLWMAGQTAAVKVVNVVSSLVLAWLLLPADFGRVGLAATVVSMAAVLTQAGVRQVLIRRQDHFARWQQAATGLSAALGGIGFLALAAAAPLAARLFHDTSVVPVILLLGLSVPINALATVPAARLQIDLRFRTVAWINVASTVVLTATAVTLASLHFGAFSIAAGQSVSDAFRCIAQWSVARVPLPTQLRVRRWKYLFGESGWLIGASALTVVLLQGDYFVLGLAQNTAAVGTYYFAYNLSTQALQLVTVNLAGVLLPVLVRVKAGGDLQVSRFLDATEVMAYFGVPVCFLQVLLARPLLELAYGHKWDAAVPALELLSLAMVPAVISGHSQVLMQAQGRYAACFAFTAFSAAALLVCAGPAAPFGPTAVAMAVGVAYALSGAAGLIWAVGLTAANARRLAALVARPSVLALAAAEVVFLTAESIDRSTPAGRWAYAIAIAIAYPLVYAAMLRGLRPTVWRTILDRLRGPPPAPATP